MLTAKTLNSKGQGIYCKGCGYDLRACLDNRCSECGREYNPMNPKTYSLHPPRPWVWRWVERGLIGTTVLIALLGGAWGWLYWEWKDEQQALNKLAGIFDVAIPESIGPTWLTKYLGPAAFVLDRVTYMEGHNLLQVTNAQLVPLHAIKWLKYLDLRGTSVSDLSPLANLTRLDTLILYNTEVADLSPLASLTELENLECSQTKVSDIFPLAKLKKLKYLAFWHTKVSDISPLANLTMLENLHFQNTKVTDLSPLSKLTALQALECRNTTISNLAPLINLTSLKQLVVPEETISEAQVQELQKALPNCEIERK